MFNRFSLKRASGALHTPFNSKNDAYCKGHPNFSSPLCSNALQAVRIQRSVPASEDPHTSDSCTASKFSNNFRASAVCSAF